MSCKTAIHELIRNSINILYIDTEWEGLLSELTCVINKNGYWAGGRLSWSSGGAAVEQRWSSGGAAFHVSMASLSAGGSPRALWEALLTYKNTPSATVGDRKLLHAHRFSSMLAHSGAQACLRVCLLPPARLRGQKTSWRKINSTAAALQFVFLRPGLLYFPSPYSVHHIDFLHNSCLAFRLISAPPRRCTYSASAAKGIS